MRRLTSSQLRKLSIKIDPLVDSHRPTFNQQMNKLIFLFNHLIDYSFKVIIRVLTIPEFSKPTILVAPFKFKISLVAECKLYLWCVGASRVWSLAFLPDFYY